MPQDDLDFSCWNTASLDLAIDDELSSISIEDNRALSRVFARRVMPTGLPSNTPQFWQTFRREFCVFIDLTNDRYAQSRSMLSPLVDKPETIVVAVISSAIGARLGMAWGALVPFCAALIKQLIEIGRVAFHDTYCKPLKLDQ